MEIKFVPMGFAVLSGATVASHRITVSTTRLSRSMYMTLIDSFRDTAGSTKLINETVGIYQALYKELGLIKK